MSRTLTAAMQTAIAAQEGYADLWLIEINTSGGVTRLTTAPQDLSWDSQTWQGIGGAISFSPVDETPDFRSQQMQLELSGVDTTIIADILNNFTRGRELTIYLGQLLLSTGAVVLDPIESFVGLINGSWEIVEETDERLAGTVRVRVTVQSYLAAAGGRRAVRTNVHSHNAFLDREGQSTGDTFFRRLPELVNKQPRWGVDTPQPWIQPPDPGPDGEDDA